MVKILVIGDLHGRMPKIHFKDFDAIVQVGDVCDDSKLAKYWKLWFQLVKEDGEDAPSAEELMLSDVGAKGIEKMEKESLFGGRKVLEYLTSFGKPVFFVPGNWDQSFMEVEDGEEDEGYDYYRKWYEMFLGDKVNPILINGLKNFYDCQYKGHVFDGINFLGYGLSNAPEKIIGKPKKDISKREIKKLDLVFMKIFDKLFSTYKKRNKRFPTFFISHNVPYGTRLDSSQDKKSYAYKKHLGSYVARMFCKKYSPLICVGGHVHEGQGKDKIGKTIVINAGYGKDAQVLIDIDERKKKIRKIEFY